jgi:hypothetical protein
MGAEDSRSGIGEVGDEPTLTATVVAHRDGIVPTFFPDAPARGPPMMRSRALLAATSSLVLATACGDDFSAAPEPPADVEGQYSVAVTNRDNGCAFESFDDGATATNIPLTVTQDGSNLSAKIGGLTGTAFSLLVGVDTLQGQIQGNELSLAIVGTATQTQGECSFSIDVHAEATASGDALQGTLEYVPDTAEGAQCAALVGCSTYQDFAGSRPPR